MGSDNYKIDIYNLMDGATSSFYLFQRVQGAEGSRERESTYVVRSSPPSTGSREGVSRIVFELPRKFFAVCGSAGSHDGVSETMIWKPVALGPGGSVFAVTAKDGNSLAWDEDAARGRSSPERGGFQILTDGSFTDFSQGRLQVFCTQLEHVVYDP